MQDHFLQLCFCGNVPPWQEYIFMHITQVHTCLISKEKIALKSENI